MFIQKIFHVHHEAAAARAQLAKLALYRPFLKGFRKLLLTADGVAQFDCEVQPGANLHGIIVELPLEERDSVLFASSAGNLSLHGLVTFREVRAGITEVQLTLNYRPISHVAWCMELFTRRIEKFIERGIRTLQGCVDGTLSHSPQAVSAARAMRRQAQLAR